MTDKSTVDDNIRKYYDVKRKIGSGAYGSVWECLDRGTRRRVAVKKIQEAFRNPQDSQRTYREVALLRAFRRHPNIVTLLEVRRASNNMDLYLVFEHMEIDLHQLINRKDFSLCDHHYRLITYQILKAIKYIHSGGIVHRDLKPSNILVNAGCVVKVGDLGLARTLRGASQAWNSQDQLMTGYVATRWYRPPEILLSSKRYTRGVDMWSLGCILAEMILGSPLFKGENTESQLRLVMASIPWPSLKDMEAVKLLGGSKLSTSKHMGRGSLSTVLSDAGASHLASDLVQKLLVFNPDKRPPAAVALLHPYLSRMAKGRAAPALRHYVTLSLRDDIQLSVDSYRQHLYKDIDSFYTKQTTTPTPLHQSTKVEHITPDMTRRSNSLCSFQRNYQKNQLPSLYPQKKQIRSKIPLRAESVQMKRQQSSTGSCKVQTKVIRTCSVVNTRDTVREQAGKPKPLYSASLPNLRPANSAVSIHKAKETVTVTGGSRLRPGQSLKLSHSISQDSGYLTGNSAS